MRAGEAQFQPQEIDQMLTGGHTRLHRFAVYRQGDVDLLMEFRAHAATPSIRATARRNRTPAR